MIKGSNLRKLMDQRLCWSATFVSLDVGNQQLLLSEWQSEPEGVCSLSF